MDAKWKLQGEWRRAAYFIFVAIQVYSRVCSLRVQSECHEVRDRDLERHDSLRVLVPSVLPPDSGYRCEIPCTLVRGGGELEAETRITWSRKFADESHTPNHFTCSRIPDANIGKKLVRILHDYCDIEFASRQNRIWMNNRN